METHEHDRMVFLAAVKVVKKYLNPHDERIWSQTPEMKVFVELVTEHPEYVKKCSSTYGKRERKDGWKNVSYKQR